MFSCLQNFVFSLCFLLMPASVIAGVVIAQAGVTSPIAESDASISGQSPAKLFGCEAPGPVRWVTVSPRKVKLGPGETVCLKVSARDVKGCPVPGEPKWAVTQKGVIVRGLLTSAGCFRAGETAAEAEGRYRVTARTGGRSASADIDVVFPEMGGLVSARLDPLDDIVEAVPSDAPTATRGGGPSYHTSPSPGGGAPSSGHPVQGTSSVAGYTSSASDRPNNRGALVLRIGGFLALCAIIGVSVFLVSRRATRRRRETLAEYDDWPEEETAAEANLVASITQRSGSVILTKKCVRCGRAFESDAQYCPYDKSELVAAVTPSQVPETGMICPQCSRGYGAEARFCPHDAEPLVSYAAWRARKESR